MLVVEQVKEGGVVIKHGIQVGNVGNCNPHKDNPECSWLGYFDKGEYRVMVVAGTPEEIQAKMFVARHGKKMPKV